MNTKRYRKLRKRKTRRIMRGGNFMNLFKGPTAPRIKFARPGSVLSLSQVLYLCRKKCNEMELSKNTNIFKKCNSEKYQIIGRILMDRGFETRIKRIEPDVEKTEAQDWCDNIKIAEFGESEPKVRVEVIQVPVDPTTPDPTTPAPRPDNTPDPRPANTPDPRPDNTPANTPPPRPPPINPKPSNLKPVLKKNSTSNDCTIIHNIDQKILQNNAFLRSVIERYTEIIKKETNKIVKASYETRLECFNQKLNEFHQNVTKKHI